MNKKYAVIGMHLQRSRPFPTFLTAWNELHDDLNIAKCSSEEPQWPAQSAQPGAPPWWPARPVPGLLLQALHLLQAPALALLLVGLAQVASLPSTTPGQELFRSGLVYPGASSYWLAFWTAATIGLPWQHPAACSYWLAFWQKPLFLTFSPWSPPSLAPPLRRFSATMSGSLITLVHTCSSSSVACISTCYVPTPLPRMVNHPFHK